jgi:hypothetical protein
MTDPKQRSLERRLLAALFLLLGLYYAWLLITRRLPRGHDTLAAYVLQYLFLVQSSQGGSVPFWLPYSTHGSVTSWHFLPGSGLLTQALLLVGVPQGANAFPIFQLGMLLEEIVLLVGTWRLGAFFFRSPAARFFVTLSMVGSSFWAEQIWHNHRVLYAIPLILSFLYQFLEDGRRLPLFLGLNLLALQFLGNAPYSTVMTILITGIYLGGYVALFRRRFDWTRLRPRPVDGVILLVNLAVVACFYLTLTSGTQEAAIAPSGRNADGTVSLDHYMTFAGALGPVRFLDLLLGTSPLRDFTLYFGVAAVPLAILGIALRPGRPTLHFALGLVLVAFLSVGYLSCVAMVLYYSAPPVHFYRYLCVVGVHVRIPLLFLAGFGVEGLLHVGSWERPLLRKTAAALAALGIVCGACALFYLRDREPPLDLPHLVQTPIPILGTSQGSDASGFLAGIFGGTSIAAFGLAAVLALRTRRPEWAPLLAGALLVFQAADLARWRFQLTRQRTRPLTDEQYALQELRPIPYVPRRAPDERRARVLAPAFFDDGAAYETADAYFHRDPPASSLPCSFWSRPMDLLLRAYAGAPLDGPTPVRPAILRGTVRPPFDKLIGLSMDKLQVFSRAHVVGNDALMASLLNDEEFHGDVLLIAPTEGVSALSAIPLDANERLDVACVVESFDANAIRIKVAAPSPAWLLYCDAWHPDWRALVNGRSVAPARAFLAYKAVPLEPGDNVVEFRMAPPVRIWTFRVTAVNAALWVLGVIALAAAAFARRESLFGLRDPM